MITNFNTPTTSAGKEGNTLMYLIIGAVALYLGYKYLIKPEMDKAKLQEKNQ